MFPSADDFFVHSFVESTLAETLLETLIAWARGHFNDDINVDGRAYVWRSRVCEQECSRRATDEDNLIDQIA